MQLKKNIYQSFILGQEQEKIILATQANFKATETEQHWERLGWDALEDPCLPIARI